MSSVVTRGMVVMINADSGEDLAATGEDDTHMSRLEEVLIGGLIDRFVQLSRETYVVP